MVSGEGQALLLFSQSSPAKDHTTLRNRVRSPAGRSFKSCSSTLGMHPCFMLGYVSLPFSLQLFVFTTFQHGGRRLQ